ncbi:MAG: hypothetical protein QNJ90_14105 [Planctomycetota bacterium]|nr:hypothetical protein [Planctomycetota bacterium]
MSGPEFPPRVWSDFNCPRPDEHLDMERAVAEMRHQGVEPQDGLALHLFHDEVQLDATLHQDEAGAWSVRAHGSYQYPRLRIPTELALRGAPFPLDDPLTTGDIRRERFRLSDGIDIPLHCGGWWVLTRAHRRPDGQWEAGQEPVEWWNEPRIELGADVAGATGPIPVGDDVRRQMADNDLPLIAGARLWFQAGDQRNGGLLRLRADGSWWLELDRAWYAG